MVTSVALLWRKHFPHISLCEPAVGHTTSYLPCRCVRGHKHPQGAWTHKHTTITPSKAPETTAMCHNGPFFSFREGFTAVNRNIQRRSVDGSWQVFLSFWTRSFWQHEVGNFSKWETFLGYFDGEDCWFLILLLDVFSPDTLTVFLYCQFVISSIQLLRPCSWLRSNGDWGNFFFFSF